MAAEPDIEKKRKRRRSARVYVNVDDLSPAEIAERLAAVAQYFPSDDEDQAVAKPDTAKRRISQAERRRLAADHKALPDGSYPVETAEDLHNAAVLARTGHGDVEAARKLIARRAKELRVSNPLESSEKAAGNPHSPGGRSVTDRISPPLTAGHQAPSTGDHGADPMNVPGPRSIAYGHQDMRQSQHEL